MQIKNLTIENFRSVQRIEINDISHALLLFGRNRQGKSSILFALQYLLYGRCPLTARNGNGYRELIRDGQQQAYVSVTITHNDTAVDVSVTITRKGSPEFLVTNHATGEVLDGITSREKLWHSLGIDQRYAEVCAMPAEYIGVRDGREMSTILADLLASDINLDDVCARLKTDAARQWLVAYAAENPIRTVDDLRATGDAAYQQRRNAKTLRAERESDLANAKAGLVLPVRDTKGNELTVDDLDRVSRAVATLAARIETLSRELGAAQASGACDVAAIQASHDAARVRVDETRAAEAAAQSVFDLAEAEYASARAVANEALAVRDRIDSQLRKLESMGDICPTCGQACDTAEAQTTLRAQRAEAHREQTEAAAVAAVKLEAMAEARRTAKAAADATAKAERELSDMAAQLASCDANTRSPETIETEIAETKSRIADGEAIVRNLAALREVTNAAAGIESLIAKVETLDEIVDAFRAGGVTNDLSSGGVSDFESRVNAELATFGDYRMAVALDGKNTQLMLACPGEPARPVWHCSGGSRLVAQYAVAMAFADVGGPVVLDEVNALDIHHRAQLVNRLRNSDAGTVIVAAAWQQRTVADDLIDKLSPATTVWLGEK